MCFILYLFYSALAKSEQQLLIVKVYQYLAKRTNNFIQALRKEFELVISSGIFDLSIFALI